MFRQGGSSCLKKYIDNLYFCRFNEAISPFNRLNNDYPTLQKEIQVSPFMKLNSIAFPQCPFFLNSFVLSILDASFTCFIKSFEDN